MGKAAYFLDYNQVTVSASFCRNFSPPGLDITLDYINNYYCEKAVE